MPKDLKGKELPKGIYQRKDGRYEARASVNGIKVQLYNFNLKQLKVDFEKAKEEAKQGVDKKLSEITLNEWFEEWFVRYKIPKIKETSINPMRTKYRSNYGRLIGDMKVSEIRNMDIQAVINTMQKRGEGNFKYA